VGEQKMVEVRISIIDYDAEHYDEREVKNIEECFMYKETSTVTWINIDGLHQIDVIEKIGKHFNLHPLLLEDVINTDRRPKVEEYDDHLFLIMKMLYMNENTSYVESEQVSLVIGSNFVISFQEREGDVFDPIRDRLRKNKGRIRKSGSDYLAYSLLDTVIDHYFTVLEIMSEKMEAIEQTLLSYPTRETLDLIHRLKKDMVLLRKSVWPLREVMGSLERCESSLINKSSIIYLRDAYDHVIQVIDTIESLRDTVTGMLDIYLSNMSNKTNEVMKILTIFAAIFIPLTFIVGVYGMNFVNMPELQWRYGYFIVWGLIIVITIGLVVFFKTRKWF
jgi:magnesium transporter